MRSDTDERVWLTIDVLVYPKSVQWGSGHSSVQATGVPPHQTHHTMSLWSSLCAQGLSHAARVKVLPKTADTKLEADISIKCLCVL